MRDVVSIAFKHCCVLVGLALLLVIYGLDCPVISCPILTILLCTTSQVGDAAMPAGPVLSAGDADRSRKVAVLHAARAGSPGTDSGGVAPRGAHAGV